MIWERLRLGDALRIKHGFAFKGEFFSDQGECVVLTPGNFHEEGGFRRRPGKDRYYSGDIPEAFVLNPGDLIVAMTEQGAGLLGSSALIPDGETYLHNQRLGLVEKLDENKLDRTFLYYLFNTRLVRGQISGSATGTKVRHTAPERIYRVEVPVPPDVRVQAKIGRILSAYDDLIKNNHRRIQLLEESARLLYKEWFVHLRFPGHEHVKVIDGIPESWHRLPLGELLTLQRGFDLPTKARNDGPYPIYASTGINGYHSEAKVPGPGVVTGRSGSLGTVMYVPSDFWPLNTALWVKEFKRVTPLFASQLLASMHLEQYNGGAAVPTLNRNDVHRVECLCPPKVLLDAYDDFAQPAADQLTTLERHNAALARARDLLLPRLMNGEVAA